MTCEELLDSYEMHALGLLEDPERAALEEHLRRGCDVCSAGIQRAYTFNAGLLATLPEEVHPSSRLRGRVLASVGAREPGSWKWTFAWASAVAALALVTFYLSVQNRNAQSELALARQRVAKTTGDLTQAQETLSFLREADTKAVTFGKGMNGRVYVNKSRGVLLIANNLPPAPAGKTYELWVIPKGGAPQPAGLFQSSETGSVMYLSKTTTPDLSAVAVSVEPESGSQAPTTTPILVVPVAD